MTEVYDATWYDTAMTEPDAPAMLPLEESPWLAMYEELAGWIAPHEEVVDLGCGTGRFLELLRREGHYAKATGVDWSMAALEEAFAYYEGAASFRREDLREWAPDLERAGNTVYICSEVLEHLDAELDLVRRIPPGHRFLFSVPNFDSLAHERVFPSLGYVWDRYSHLLTFRRWSLIALDERKAIHVCETVRRLDSW